jgi:ABC-type cobalamin/Fe3+-siderophores transport system ATPase subunit
MCFIGDGCRLVPEDVSFDVRPGVCVGIVAPTGVGKTTLLGLLPRFYDPGEGAILLDQVDLRDYRLADLRRQFAIVLQEPVLFSASIAENIAYGRAGRTRPRSSPPPRQAPTNSSRGSPARTTARAHSASATWCSRLRTAGWWPPTSQEGAMR